MANAPILEVRQSHFGSSLFHHVSVNTPYNDGDLIEVPSDIIFVMSIIRGSRLVGYSSLPTAITFPFLNIIDPRHLAIHLIGVAFPFCVNLILVSDAAHLNTGNL